ncbi:MAG: SDR family oxidoreductase [Treponema sp.]|jgi:NAD(P)-dependent dehydrogenase (short-subunit alcohol dehydrogenase family)|nr:SDR family oxidoreductase [Treponema sp.]
MGLKDKVVFITDGLSPAGQGIAARLAEEGARVAANVFPAGPGSSVRAELVTHGDPLSGASIEGAVREVLDTYGCIDVLVFNNNELIPAALEFCDDETYDRVMGVNVKSAYLYVRAAGPAMKERRAGNFVFVSSIHGEKPFGGCFAYSMAKGCLKNLAREMVLDMGKYNIRTNVIEMGPMEGSWEDFYSDASPLYEHARERVNGPRMGTVQDIAEAVLYFAGGGSGFANGSELRLDGGFLLTYVTARRNLDRATGEEIKQIW